jgi:GTP cyclohydrolase II
MRAFEVWLEGAAEHRQRSGYPLVSLCYAQSLDGSLAARRGQPTHLSGDESSKLTHKLRAAHDAILVGVGTVLADDPLLTVRLVEGKNPVPVVLDSRLRIPLTCNLLSRRPQETWIATTHAAPQVRRSALKATGARLLLLDADAAGHVSLPALLSCLGEQGINSLMVEGGAQVITSFLEQRLVDQIALTIAPVLLGGLTAIQGSLPAPFHLQNIEYERLGDDMVVWGKVENDQRVVESHPH